MFTSLARLFAAPVAKAARPAPTPRLRLSLLEGRDCPSAAAGGVEAALNPQPLPPRWKGAAVVAPSDPGATAEAQVTTVTTGVGAALNPQPLPPRWKAGAVTPPDSGLTAEAKIIIVGG